MSNKAISGNNLFLIITILIIVIFFADLYFKVQAAIPVLFVAPILLTLFHLSKIYTIYVAAICSALTIALFFISGFETSTVVNFLISITGIWVAFYFILRFKNASFSEAKNKERLNALFEYSTEGMIIASGRGEIMMINPMAERQFGYEKGELVGKRIEVLIPDRFSERHVKHRESYSRNPYPRPMGKGNLLHAKRKDLTEFPVEISLSNFTTEEGKFTIAFIIDISDRRKSEELLQSEKELAQMYLDIAPVIFLVLEKNQTVRLINQNGCQILGYPENEIVNKNWFDLFVSTEDKQNSKNLFTRMMEGKASSIDSFEYEIETASGHKRLIAWKNSIIRDERGNTLAILSAGEDITERKLHEELIEKANIELKQYSEVILKLNSDLEKRVKERTEELGELVRKLENTNKELAIEIKERRQAELLLEKKREELNVALEKEKELSELKSRFVTMASHEFRTPLSTILSSASLISKYNETGEDEKRTKHIERVKSSVHNLTSILNDFLSLGKLEEGKIQCTPSEFDISSFCNDLVNELKEVTKKGQTISYKHSGSSSKVYLDKNLTRNICINLISNAIKYSGEGSSILFKTEISESHLQISIEDCGIGIPESETQHIFERFFRAKNALNIQGTGLGLNIVKKYTELMSGEVSFTSIDNKGTTFIVKLPTKPVNNF